MRAPASPSTLLSLLNTAGADISGKDGIQRLDDAGCIDADIEQVADGLCVDAALAWLEDHLNAASDEDPATYAVIVYLRTALMLLPNDAHTALMFNLFDTLHHTIE